MSSESFTEQLGHISTPHSREATSGSSSPAHRGHLRGLQTITHGVSDHVLTALSSDRVYLVPLRAFIGISWLRSFTGKAMEPGWRDGTSLSGFLNYHLESGQIAFPAYQTLVTEVFLPHAAVLGWIVMIGELLAGLGILFGGFTSAALLGATFMNLNFLLAGAAEPSVFFIAIQALLLLMGAGAVMGVDARLSRTIHHALLVSQPVTRRQSPPRPQTALPVMLLALVVAGYGLAHVTAWSPKGGVQDPAMVLALVGSLVAGWSAVALLQATFGQHPVIGRNPNGGGGRTHALPR